MALAASRQAGMTERHGFLVVEYPISGDKYEGEWVHGKKHGKGRYTSSNGDIYEGEYKDGKRSGEGLYTYSNGDQFEGMWKDGKKNGKGTMLFVNGDRYAGEYLDDLKGPRGVYSHIDGSKYDGEYRDGKPCGSGTYTFPDSTVFYGQFLGGFKHGRGRVTMPDGLVYEAMFNMGKRVSRKFVTQRPTQRAPTDGEYRRMYDAYRDSGPGFVLTYGGPGPARPVPAGGPGPAGEGMGSTFSMRTASSHSDEGGAISRFLSAVSDDELQPLRRRAAPSQVPTAADAAVGGGYAAGVAGGGGGGEYAAAGGWASGGRGGAGASSRKKGILRRAGTQQSHLVSQRGRETLDGVADDPGASHTPSTQADATQEARRLFDAIDRDGNGQLDADELAKALIMLGFSEGKIAAIFVNADTDRSGMISFDEFQRGIVPIIMTAQETKDQMRRLQTGRSLAEQCIEVLVLGCRDLLGPPAEAAARAAADKAAAEAAGTASTSSGGEESGASCSPFVQLELGSQRHQTRVKLRTDKPFFGEQFRLFVSPPESQMKALVVVHDWNMGKSMEMGRLALPVEEILREWTLPRRWYRLQPPPDSVGLRRGQGPQNMGEVEIQVECEAIPIMLEVAIFCAENLPWGGTGVGDSFVRAAFRDVVHDTEVVKASSRPDFNETFRFNLFAEDVAHPLSLTVMDWSKYQAAGGVLGQVKVPLLPLLQGRGTVAGWFDLADLAGRLVTSGAGLASMASGTGGGLAARLELKITCQLRRKDNAGTAASAAAAATAAAVAAAAARGAGQAHPQDHRHHPPGPAAPRRRQGGAAGAHLGPRAGRRRSPRIQRRRGQRAAFAAPRRRRRRPGGGRSACGGGSGPAADPAGGAHGQRPPRGRPRRRRRLRCRYCPSASGLPGPGHPRRADRRAAPARGPHGTVQRRRLRGGVECRGEL